MNRIGRRGLLVTGIVVAVALVAVFHRPLTAWFFGADASPGGTGAVAKASAGPLSLALSLEPDPPRQQGNVLVVAITDADARPVEQAEVTVEYLMPAMGSMAEMKGGADVYERGGGHYRARFDLPMGGSWMITTRVRSQHGDGEATHALTVGKRGLTLVSGSIATSDVAAKAKAAKAKAVKALQLPPRALGATQEAISALDRARAKLAADSLEGLGEHAVRVAAMMREASTVVEADDAKQCLDGAAAAADALARATDLESARKLFSVVSSYATMLAVADPRLQEGWDIFECPMARGFNKWLQRGDALENPYMGKKMLACGTKSTFTLPVAMPVHDHGAHAADDDEVEYYTCAMHPSVKQEQPGNCPVCAMPLTPVTKGELKSGIVLVDDTRRQKIGVKTARVETRAVAATITTVGRVVYDEEQLHDVALKIGGFVEELFVDQTGQKVTAGQPLFLLYSPELYAAQVEYLQAVKTADTLGGNDFTDSLIRSARRRLELWGLGQQQIEDLVARGAATDKVPILSPASGYVIEKNVVKGSKLDQGATVYRIAGLDEIWVEAHVYEADVPKVQVGQPATITLAYQPGKELSGQVAFIYPFLDGESRTGRVRVTLKNPGLDLKPEMYANVTIHGRDRALLVVPESAVIYTGPRRLVFIDLGAGRLQPTEVRLGKKSGETFEVLDGVQEGDVVVTSGNFLIAAESRLKGATAFWAHDHEPGVASSPPPPRQPGPDPAGADRNGRSP